MPGASIKSQGVPRAVESSGCTSQKPFCICFVACSLLTRKRERPCLCPAQEPNRNFLGHALWGGGGQPGLSFCGEGSPASATEVCMPPPHPGSQSAPPWPGRNGLREGGDLHDGGLLSLPSSPAQTLSPSALLRNLWNSLRPESGHQLCLSQSTNPASPTSSCKEALVRLHIPPPTQREEGFPGGSVVVILEFSC